MPSKTCESVISVGSDTKPRLCGEPAVQIGEVVKCRKHWTQSRRLATRARKRFPQPKE